MANVHLQAWLDGSRNYAEGVKIFERYGSGGFLLDILQMGETDYNRTRLLKEIINLNDLAAEPVLHQVAGRQIVTDKEFEKLPEDAKQLLAATKALIKENSDRKGQIRSIFKQAMVISDLEKRRLFCIKHNTGVIANELLDVRDIIQENFNRLDYFKIHNRWPDQQPLPDWLQELSLIQLITQRDSARSRISRIKNNPGNEEELIRLRQKINLIELHIKKIE